MAASEMMGERCVVGTQSSQVNNALHADFASRPPEERGRIAVALRKSL
jgi:hypothetical protein